MASGLTESTSPNETCAEWLARGYTADALGLRDGGWGSCGALVGGSFATVHARGAPGGGALLKVRIALRDRHGVERHSRTIDAATCRAA